MPSRKNRGLSRKNRASRRDRKNRSRSRRNRSLKGGMAPLNDTSMNMAQRDSLAQGSQYLNIHKGQYGGAAAPYPTAVTNSVLSGPMIAATRTGPLDAAISQIQGMQDGGRRRRKNRKGGKRTRKHPRSRKHRGGSHSVAVGAPVTADAMLLPSGMDKSAALHNEWADAKNPNTFVPKA
uniref:Uncharacterized protein n=1 Tax=viral metagenome TaxID=1070528 RepID=A0A6C0DHV9_9ZZZZ